MKRLLIARIRHHAGQLEYVLSLCKCLGISDADIYIQVEKSFYNSLFSNCELNAIVRAEFSNSFLLLPASLRFYKFLTSRACDKQLSSFHRLLFSFSASFFEFFLGLFYLLAVCRFDVDELYIVNAPFFCHFFIFVKRVFTFRTPISPTLMTYGVLSSSLVSLNSKGELQMFGSFPSPSLSSCWSDLLMKYSSYPSYVKPTIDSSLNLSSKLLLLAYRNPSNTTLSLDDTILSLQRISVFLCDNPSYRVIYRSHPRHSVSSPNQIPQELITDILGVSAVCLNNHLRVLAAQSVAMISFCGSAPLEAIPVGCPVLEILPSDSSNLGRLSFQASKYGLARSVYPADVDKGILSLMHKSIYFRSHQFSQLNFHMPGFSDSSLTKEKLNYALNLLPRHL